MLLDSRKPVLKSHSPHLSDRNSSNHSPTATRLQTQQIFLSACHVLCLRSMRGHGDGQGVTATLGHPHAAELACVGKSQAQGTVRTATVLGEGLR